MSHLGFMAFLVMLAYFATLALTRSLRQYALKRDLLDHPNARSSHQVPTPRGGGAAFVMCFLLGLLVLWVRGIVATRLMIALLGGGGLVAWIGFWDDHGHVRRRYRLLAHFLAAFWALAWLGGSSALGVEGDLSPWGHWVFNVLVAVGLVWFLNLYNFMDGIDGIAGIEALTAGGCMGLLALAAQLEDLGWLSILLAASSAGFLFWNWPPATIFMGDVGSGFLGYIFGVLLLAIAEREPSLFGPSLLLFSLFFVDGTLTLGIRILTGQRWYDAHRNHAYQHASRRWGHLPVTLAVGGINLLLLVPLALLAWQKPQISFVLILTAVTAIGILAYSLGAGRREKEGASSQKSPSLSLSPGGDGTSSP